MVYCKHTQWLGLVVKDGAISLQATDRVHTLLDNLPDPEEQTPSLLVFIGNKAKSKAIRELVKNFSPPPRYGCEDQDSASKHPGSMSGRRGPGEIHLHVHSASIFSARPVLLAEGDLPVLEKQRGTISTADCHEIITKELSFGTTKSLSETADHVYFRLLSPFVDVFCFFSSDIGGFGPIARRLALWLDMGTPSTLPKSTQPRILIVVEVAQMSTEETLAAFMQLLRDETARDSSDQFSGISVVHILPRKDVSDRARHRTLKEELLNSSDKVHEARKISRTLFSASHFAAFFKSAYEHFVQNLARPLDFIIASRIKNPVTPDLELHVSTFLSKLKVTEQVMTFAIPVLASSLLLDSYPPDMHIFDPLDVFQTLYKQFCQRACRTGVLVHLGSIYLLPTGFIKELEAQFAKQFQVFASQTTDSMAEIHQETLWAHINDWVTLYSDKTCFICMLYRPQYKLPCGHFVCDNCVRVLGTSDSPLLFKVSKCFLCQQETSGFSMKVKPPTATIRLLSIDGGGARGVAPLMFLQALQERIGLPYPVQENFDLAFGTSSGGIIVLALFVNGWAIEDCVDHFERLAKVAFQQNKSSIPLLSEVLAFLVSLFTDHLYSAHALEAALQDVFGNTKGILDYSNATAIGARIGITVSSMEPKPYLFTNYNGVGNRSENSYGILHGNVPLWEIARSTSAAPWFFTTKSIAGLGKFQDGGLKHNNPIKLALKEVEVLFPDDPSAKRSTLKVSLGTGLPLHEGQDLSGSSKWWRDLWFCRLFRVLWSSMDTQESSDAIHRKVLKSQKQEGQAGKKETNGGIFPLEHEVDESPAKTG